MTSFSLFDFVVVITVALQALNFYWLSKGRISYRLMIAIYLGFGTVEAWLAARDPFQFSVMLFVALDLWAILMAYKGLLKEREQ